MMLNCVCICIWNVCYDWFIARLMWWQFHCSSKLLCLYNLMLRIWAIQLCNVFVFLDKMKCNECNQILVSQCYFWTILSWPAKYMHLHKSQHITCIAGSNHRGSMFLLRVQTNVYNFDFSVSACKGAGICADSSESNSNTIIGCILNKI